MGDGRQAARLAVLLLAVLFMAVPVSARRTRRSSRHWSARYRVTFTVPKRPATPAIEPVRNVILFIGSGYSASAWDAAREANPDGLLNIDRMPVTAAVLSPQRTSVDPARMAWWLGTGAAGFVDPPPPTLPALAKRAGKSLALVSGGAVTDPLPAFLAAPTANPSPLDTLRHLVLSRVDALFGRTQPEEAAPGPETYGYTVVKEPQAVLMAETTPVLATASREAMPFDTLTFRALHLAARNPRGFILAVGATPKTVAPAEFNAALGSVLGYARRDKHTLVLVVLCTDAGPCGLYAEGMSAHKFGGTLMMTDVPKILAGVAALNGMARDFSPLYVPRLAAQAPPAPRGRGLVPLPW